MERLTNVLSDLAHLNLEDQIVNKQAHASGLGGSCDVYTAWSVKHRKKVAVKQIRIFMRKDQAFMKRLAREIRIWATLDHECILPFLGYFTEGENMLPSLVSEWMERGTMVEFKKKIGNLLQDTELWSMARGIASGLEYLHANGVIHADLKGSNILISPTQTPILVDFGLSLALYQSVTETTTYSMGGGSVRWMAVELLAPEPVTHCESTDIWAFGMVIYELLSSDVPYNAFRSDLQVIPAITRGELPARPDTGLQHDLVSDALWDLCCVCWTTDPLDRPTASQLSSVLSQYPASNEPLTLMMASESTKFGASRRGAQYKRKGRLYALLPERFPYNKDKSWFRVDITLTPTSVRVQHQYSTGACETVDEEITFSGGSTGDGGEGSHWAVTPFEKTRITPYPYGWSYPFAVGEGHAEDSPRLVLAAISPAERAAWLAVFRDIAGFAVGEVTQLSDDIAYASRALP